MTTQTITADNGVNVEALLGAREGADRRPRSRAIQVARQLRMDPGHPQPRHRRWLLRPRRRAEASPDVQFDTDHPEIFASEDKGATPVEMVLVGLAGCLTAGIAAVAQHRNIQLSRSKRRSRAAWTCRASSASTRTCATASTASRCTSRSMPMRRADEIAALVAQSQKRSAVFDIVTNPTNVSVTTSKVVMTRLRAAPSLPAPLTWSSSVPATAGLAMSRVLVERGDRARGARARRGRATPGAPSAGIRCACSRPTGMTPLPGYALPG